MKALRIVWAWLRCQCPWHRFVRMMVQEYALCIAVVIVCATWVLPPLMELFNMGLLSRCIGAFALGGCASKVMTYRIAIRGKRIKQEATGEIIRP